MEALEFDVVPPLDERLVDEVRTLVKDNVTRSVGPGLSEERLRALDRAVAGDSTALVVGIAARRPGSDGLFGWAQIDVSGSGLTPTFEIVVRPDPDGAVVEGLADTALAAFGRTGRGPLRWWVGHATDADDRRAHDRGFTTERDLLQLRCPLPLPGRTHSRPTAAITTRAFRVGRDEPGWLLQNNRAFAGHPEQGRWDRATLDAREAEPWFDPEGFRVLEVEGRIAGSCWTKIHNAEVPPLGEIYVIGVDPDFHGRGWGRALTEDGFAWLASQGLTHGMLYVDAANTAASNMYYSMGMESHHVDRAYVIPTVRAPVGEPGVGRTVDRSPSTGADEVADRIGHAGGRRRDEQLAGGRPQPRPAGEDREGRTDRQRGNRP